MSRGRPPRLACREACTSAAHRGMVLDAAGMVKSRIDFILFDRQRVIFVRVKRSHSRIMSVGELAIRFRGDIAEIRKVPLTPVVSRELWIFLPWGTWQYFCIGDDTITEIFDDTGKVPGKYPVSAGVQVPRDPLSPGAGAGGAGSPGP